MKTDPSARSNELGRSIERAFAFIPAFDFSPAFPVGSVACGDGHTIGERKPACPNQDGADPHQNGAKS